jgi:hypothetical protein
LEGSFSGSDQSPIEYVNGMYTCMTSSETSFISKLYGQRDRYDYLIIDTGNVVVVDFNYPGEKRQAIIDDGYKQTLSYFKEKILPKKNEIFKIYSKIRDKLKQIQRFMIRKKFFAVKTSVAELFIYLSTVKDVIDSDLFDVIYLFQKLVYNNVKSGLLGRASCSNSENIETSLNAITSDVELRVIEIEKYINKFSV